MILGKMDALRTLTSLAVTLFLLVGPAYGLVYGMSSVLTSQGLTMISPLELAIVISGTGAVSTSLLVSGLIVILVIVLFGRFYCGWICPLGLLLEFFHLVTVRRARKGVGGLWINLGKYFVLAAVLLASLAFGFGAPYVFSPPGIIHRISLSLSRGTYLGSDFFMLLFISVLDFAAVRYDWTWCNSLCPLGAMISGLSIVNLVKPRVDKKLCVDFDYNCLECSRVCPMRIPLPSWWVESHRRLAMMECNKCLKCWTSCPAKAIKIRP